MLDGDRMAKSLYNIKFNENADTASLCTVELNTADIAKLQSAIEDLYYFEFIVGQLTINVSYNKLQMSPRILKNISF